MSKRSKWCQFDKDTRDIIKIRDKFKCIYCGGNQFLGIAHIWLSRAKGGKGCETNGVLLCQTCHNALDNGRDSALRKKIDKYTKAYLTSVYGQINVNKLRYRKWGD